MRELETIIARRGRPPAGDVCFRQRHRTHRYGDFALVAGDAGRVAYIASAKPQQSAFIESSNVRLGDELVNETLFTPRSQCPRGAKHLERRSQSCSPVQCTRQAQAGRSLAPATLSDRNGAERSPSPWATRPIRCSTEPSRLKWRCDSPHCWMNRGAQTTCIAC